MERTENSRKKKEIIYKYHLIIKWIELIFILNKSNTLESTIARFDPIQNSWSKLGNLKVARSSFGTIQVDDEIIVVGGKSTCQKCSAVDVPTESCKLSGQSIKCVTREPNLSAFNYYPELMRVNWF